MKTISMSDIEVPQSGRVKKEVEPEDRRPCFCEQVGCPSYEKEELFKYRREPSGAQVRIGESCLLHHCFMGVYDLRKRQRPGLLECQTFEVFYRRIKNEELAKKQFEFELIPA